MATPETPIVGRTCLTCGFWDWREHFCWAEGDYIQADGTCDFWRPLETKEAPPPPD